MNLELHLPHIHFQDELINVPVPEAAWPEREGVNVERLEGIQREGEEEDEEEEPIELVTGEERKAAAQLVPPAALFKSIDYPPLHIFVSTVVT